MKLHFFGAARTVTGSCHMIETSRYKVIVDCGMRQGADAHTEYAEGEFPFDPKEIDGCLLTHAHIDHTGLVPLLVKKGYTGEVVTTTATADLCSIMLPDSAHIQETEAEWENRKLLRQNKNLVEPLYTMEDAQQALKRFRPHEYGEMVNLNDSFKVRFNDAGHLLGSASIEVWVTEDGKTTKLLFSGDLGHSNRPLVNDPQPVEGADYVVLEGTYGDRLHEQESDKALLLRDIIADTFARGGNVIIPSFAVGRTQEILYYIRRIITEKLLPQFKEIPVYIDSPLGIEATKVFERNARRYYDKDAMAIIAKGENPILFDSLYVAATVDQSKLINDDKRSKVIISSSGMCEAGRIKHHLKHNLWRADSTILFVGYQAVGTLGRIILDGAKKVKLMGEEITVMSRVERIEGFSGHADMNELIAWMDLFKIRPGKVFLVHGEEETLVTFAKKLKDERSYDVTIPSFFEEFDLVSGAHTTSTYAAPVVTKTYVDAYAVNFTKLLEQSERVYQLLKELKGKTGLDAQQQTKLKIMEADLASFADKWEMLLK